MPSAGFLSRFSVLDLSSVGPASRCTRLLADYGASVVKVGPVPGTGSAIEPAFWAYSGQRHMQRACIDVRCEEGRQAFLALAARADVVVESFRPGVVDRLGIGYQAVRALNPSIVYCSTSGYGQQGARSSWAGHDIDYLAVGGYLASSSPGPNGEPPLPGATIADGAAGGMHAAIAICAALLARQSTGEGCHLDVSVADGVLWLMSLQIDEHLATGARPEPGYDILTGRYACYGTYQASDGRWLAVGAIEPKFFANLCRALGCERWVSHQLNDDVQDEIRADLAAAFAKRPRDEWVELLAGADTCVAPVQSVCEACSDPALVERGSIVQAEHPSVGGFRQLGPVLAGMAPASEPGHPVELRAHDETATSKLLVEAGMDRARVKELFDKKVIA